MVKHTRRHHKRRRGGDKGMGTPFQQKMVKERYEELKKIKPALHESAAFVGVASDKLKSDDLKEMKSRVANASMASKGGRTRRRRHHRRR